MTVRPLVSLLVELEEGRVGDGQQAIDGLTAQRQFREQEVFATDDVLEPDSGDGADFGDALAQDFQSRDQPLILFVQQGLNNGR